MGVGRKAVPSQLRVITGRGRIKKGEPKPERMDLQPPPTLSDRGAEFWPDIVKMLDRLGIVTEADQLALELLCEARADWMEARLEVERLGPVVMSQIGVPKNNPAVSQRENAARRIMSLLSEFGMTPASRTKVTRSEGEDEVDPAAEFFDK